MSCPLIGQIALILGPLPDLDAPAVRVRHRNHDIIVANECYSTWERTNASLNFVAEDERDLLVWGVECTCARQVWPLTG